VAPTRRCVCEAGGLLGWRGPTSGPDGRHVSAGRTWEWPRIGVSIHRDPHVAVVAQCAAGASSETWCRQTKPERLRTNPNDT